MVKSRYLRLALLAALSTGITLIACSSSNDSDDDDDSSNTADGSATSNGEDGAATQADGAATSEDGSTTMNDGGTNQPLSDFVGVRGTVNGTEYAYSGNVQFNFGAFTAYAELDGGGFDALRRWTMSGIPNTPGKYPCMPPSGQPNIGLLTGGGAGYTTSFADGGACMIDLLTVSANEVEGKFTGTFANTNGSGEVVTVSDGYFHKPHPDLGAPLGAGEEGGSFTLGGRNFRFPNASSLAYETFAGVTISSGANPIGVQIHTLPNAVGTYQCGDGAQYRNVNIWFVWDFKYYYAGARGSATPNGPAGSSCTIKLDHVGTVGGNGASNYTGTIDGSFSGTFVTTDGKDSLTVTNGLFRYTAK